MFLKILKMNETEMWFFPDEFKPFIKAVYGAYIFNPNRKTYCCEMTPSFECHFIGSQVDLSEKTPEDVIEEIDSYVREGDAHTEAVSYFHCHNIKGKCKPGFFPKDRKMGVYQESGFCKDFKNQFDLYGKSEKEIEEIKNEALIKEGMEWSKAISV